MYVKQTHVVCYRSDSDSDNESGDPEKKKLQDKLSGIVSLINHDHCTDSPLPKVDWCSFISIRLYIFTMSIFLKFHLKFKFKISSL